MDVCETLIRNGPMLGAGDLSAKYVRIKRQPPCSTLVQSLRGEGVDVYIALYGKINYSNSRPM